MISPCMIHWELDFGHKDRYGRINTAHTEMDSPSTEMLFDMGEQFNTFLKQIGFIRHNDYLFMADVTEDEELYLRGALEAYRAGKELLDEIGKSN